MSRKKAVARRRQTVILGVILTAIGVFALLELYTNPSGRHLLRTLVGIGAWPLVLFIIASGLGIIFWPQLRPRIGDNWYPEALLGLLLAFLAVITMSSARVDAPDPYVVAVAGEAGGMVGWALAQASLSTLGTLPTWSILVVMLGGGLYLIYLYTPLRMLNLPGLGTLRQKASRPKSKSGKRSSKKPAAKKQPKKAASAPKKKPTKPKADAKTAATVAAAVTATTRKPAAKKAAAKKKPTRTPKKTTTKKKTTAAAGSRRASDDLPPLTLLQEAKEGDATYEQARIMARIIEDTLASFGIPAQVVNINVGPTVTQFGVQPGTYERNGRIVRVRISNITRLADDIALALAASPVRIEAPVPGESYIGIEVPNPEPTLVGLRGVLEDPAFSKSRSPLVIPLGRDVSGEAVVADLHKLPHLLIAGATGSGKSVALNAIICGLLFNNPPDRVKMVMVDPKRVEFPGYNGIPHLLAPVVTDPEEASGALSWLLVEMDERYRKFAAAGVRNIGAYNKKKRGSNRLPYIIMLVDELADLMMTSPEIIEAKLVRLAQMARATGIHLVIATQRPRWMWSQG